jgi:hypothetical protein
VTRRGLSLSLSPDQGIVRALYSGLAAYGTTSEDDAVTVQTRGRPGALGLTRVIGALLVALALLGSAALAPALAQTGQATSVAPVGFPSNLRWDLAPKWIQWVDTRAVVLWPPNDGCAGAPQPQTLAAGTLIDRFGSEGGTFFSPKGESFASRAVPYVCTQMDYRVYRVVKPIPVKSCKAASWFGEPGGALQVQTAQPAYRLVADGLIEVVSYAVGGSGGPAPQCGRP